MAPPNPTPASSNDASTAHTPTGWTSANRRKVVLPLVMLGLSVYTLVLGIQRLRADKYCQHPLAVWLIVHGCLVMPQALLLLSRSRPGVMLPPHWLRLSLLASLLLLVAHITWLVIGAVWVWTISSGAECDSTMWKSVQSAVIIGFVILAVIGLSIANRLRKRFGGEQPQPNPALDLV